MAPRRAARLATLVVLLALAPSLSGCVLGREPLIVAASAPKAASGMTIFLATEEGFFERFRSQDASYSVYYGDRLIYPPAGKGASFPVEGRTGSAFVPYNLFVVGNGEYDIHVKYGGAETRARVRVEKWVEYVFLHPFDRGETILVETALSSATGGRPDDRILAQGELVLTLKYRGPDGRSDRTIGSISTETSHDQTSTAVAVPRSRLSAGAGYYSFEPLFHNREARDNVQVGPDPTMANLQPPWNWIYLAS